MADGSVPLEQQTTMPFEEADAARAGRWNDVSLALSRVGRKCDLHLSRFVRMVFDFTHGGADGALVKSYKALAERPSWLCCSERKARSTVELAERLGFVSIERRRAWSGSQKENSYTMNWQGIRGIITAPKAPGISCHTHGTTRHGPGTTRHTHGTTCRHTKEHKLSGSSSEEYSGTGTGTATEPNRSESDSGEGRPRTAATQQTDQLSAALLSQSPILLEAGRRRITPLPAGKLQHGVYTPLLGKHLRKPLQLVRWHRMQLSTTAPVMGPTEADLLLTIAAALYAASLSDDEVVKNRVAVFVNTIARRKFWRIMSFVTQARTLLDEGIDRHGPDWAGLADETAAAEVKTGAGT